jgi:hypothetical protein
VFVVALGAIKLGAKAWVFCIHWAKMGCNYITVFENISWALNGLSLLCSFIC